MSFTRKLNLPSVPLPDYLLNSTIFQSFIHTTQCMKDYVHYITKGHFDKSSKKLLEYLTKFYCDKTINELIVPTKKAYDLF